MPLPEIEQRRVEKLFEAFCDRRVPPAVRHQVRLIYKVTGNKVILIETRPLYNDPTTWSQLPVAQFEYSVAAAGWTLYAYNRNEKRMLYSKGPLERLLQEVDEDRTCIFWG